MIVEISLSDHPNFEKYQLTSEVYRMLFTESLNRIYKKIKTAFIQNKGICSMLRI